MMVVVVVIGVGVWPASFVVGAETSSLRLRAKTQGIGWFAGGFAQGVFGICLPYAYNVDEGNLRAKTGFIFAALCSLSWLAVWKSVPEMKDRTAAEIDTMFEHRLPTRAFKTWRGTFSGERASRNLDPLGSLEDLTRDVAQA